MAPKKRPWFRFYVEAVHDRKLRRLKPEHRWLFVACLAAARQSPEPGVLLIGENDPMTTEDLADFAGMSERSVSSGLTALRSARVIDIDTSRHAWFVPAWNARQFESDDVTARTSKHRSKEQGKNVPSNVPPGADGTPPETETETETEFREPIAPASSNALVVANGHKAPAKAGRKRDLLFEAIAAACGIDLAILTDSGRGPLNKATSELRKVGASASSIPGRAAAYHRVYPDTALTPTALAKHWSALDPSLVTAPKASNGVQGRSAAAIARAREVTR